jgi:hypothetical protein
LRVPPDAPRGSVKVRTRAARRAVKGAVDVAEAEARAQRVAAKLLEWDHDTGGPSLLASARVGTGRRLPMVDTTPLEGPLEPGPSAGRGVVKNDAGRRARGDTLAPVRTVLDQAGRITPRGLAPIPGQDVPVWRPCFARAPG